MNNSQNWSDKTILVAEDEEFNYLFIEEVLSTTQAKMIWALDGKEAVAICETQKIDLILMDLKMPIMDGYEATRMIKSQKQELPIIAQTAFAMAGDEKKIMNAGFDAYLTKPLGIELLLSTIQNWI